MVACTIFFKEVWQNAQRKELFGFLKSYFPEFNIRIYSVNVHVSFHLNYEITVVNILNTYVILNPNERNCSRATNPEKMG